MLRMKAAAMILGPAGVGLFGLLQQIMTTASSIAGLGMSSSGTRQIAEASGKSDEGLLLDTRHALFMATNAMALSGGVVVWLLREPIASYALNDPTKSGLVGGLAIGVTLSTAAIAQMSLLNGLRKVGHLARINILSAVTSTLIGIPALVLLGETGLLVMIIAVPFSNYVFGRLYASGFAKGRHHHTTIEALTTQWHKLLKLGGAFMLAGVVVMVGQLLVRTLVQRELGEAELGYYVAAWTISMTYIGFALNAMSTDYYPRLTSVVGNNVATNNLINEQTEVALLLTAPIFTAMMTLGPWVIELLYSKDFLPADQVLRWQILGDIIKVISWPLGFLILAAADGKKFMATESISVATFLGVVILTMPSMGIVATGASFVAMYAVYLPAVYLLARKRTGFHWNRAVLFKAFLLFSACLSIFIASKFNDSATLALGLPVTLAYSISAWTWVKKHLAVG